MSSILLLYHMDIHTCYSCVRNLPGGHETTELNRFLMDAHSVRSVMSLDSEVSNTCVDRDIKLDV